MMATMLRLTGPLPIERVVEAAESLDAFPASAARIRDVADNPGASLVDLERAVSSDPAVSAMVLRVANSAFFGLPRSVVSVRDALLVLGFAATRDLALSVALLASLRGAGPLRDRIWTNSVRTAAAARAIGARSPGVDSRAVFVAGLLHEIGILILLQLFRVKYEEIVRPVYGRDAELLAAEQARLGFDHPALGGACLRRWQIPEPIADAVRWHHDVDLAPERVPAEAVRAATVIWAAEQLQRRLAVGKSPQETAVELAGHPCMATLGLGTVGLEAVARELDAEVARFAMIR